MFNLKNFAKRLGAAVGTLLSAVAIAVTIIPSVVPIAGAPFALMAQKASEWTKICFNYVRDAEKKNPVIDDPKDYGSSRAPGR